MLVPVDALDDDWLVVDQKPAAFRAQANRPEANRAALALQHAAAVGLTQLEHLKKAILSRLDPPFVIAMWEIQWAKAYESRKYHHTSVYSTGDSADHSTGLATSAAKRTSAVPLHRSIAVLIIATATPPPGPCSVAQSSRAAVGTLAL